MMVYINFPQRIKKIQEELAKKGVDVLVGTRLKTITHWSGGLRPVAQRADNPGQGGADASSPRFWTSGASRTRAGSRTCRATGRCRVSISST